MITDTKNFEYYKCGFKYIVLCLFNLRKYAGIRFREGTLDDIYGPRLNEESQLNYLESS